MKKNLHFFTASFPYGNAPEGAFVVPELDYINNDFNQIYIYTLRKTGTINYNLPHNVSIVDINFNNKIEISFKAKINIMLIVLSELAKNKNFRKFSTFKFLYSQLKEYYKKGQKILPVLQNNIKKDDLLYTFWFAEWNYILSLLKAEQKINNKLVSKAHRFDLYNESHKLNTIPFRKLQLDNTHKIFSISNQGKDYLAATYPKNKHQFEVAKLGTFKHGTNPKSALKDTLILVSCSSISNVKRVHLIAEILKDVTTTVRWTHFGNGVNLKQVEESIKQLPSNITVELKGHVNNQEVIDFYKVNPVDLFINVSESEGIPVSMMEAISFGIPIVAYNVGGVSEILNNQTGLLVTDKDDLTTISNFMNNFKGSNYETEKYRAGIVDFWEKEYSAEINHTQFSKAIRNL